MVLDRTNATLWGDAPPLSKVTVTLVNAGTYTAIAAADSSWTVSLGAIPAGVGRELYVVYSDGRSARLEDVAFGEVLLCSGQSNSEISACLADTPTSDCLCVHQCEHAPSVHGLHQSVAERRVAPCLVKTIPTLLTPPRV